MNLLSAGVFCLFPVGIARKRAIRIEPTGAWAANLLGLSTQVPVKIVYLTNGKPSTYTIGKNTSAQR